MGWLRLTDHVLLALLMAVAVVVARREATHRPLAAYFVWSVVTEWLRLGLNSLRNDAPRPYVGFARVVQHIDELIVLGWWLLPLALCAHYFLRRRASSVFGAWAVTWLICLQYPLISGPVLLWIYRLVSGGCLACEWACVLFALVRGRELKPSLAHLVLLFLLGGDTVVNLVPLAGGFFGQWPVVLASNCLVFLAAIASHCLWLWSRRDEPRRTAQAAVAS